MWLLLLLCVIAVRLRVYYTCYFEGSVCMDHLFHMYFSIHVVSWLIMNLYIPQISRAFTKMLIDVYILLFFFFSSSKSQCMKFIEVPEPKFVILCVFRNWIAWKSTYRNNEWIYLPYNPSPNIQRVFSLRSFLLCMCIPDESLSHINEIWHLVITAVGKPSTCDKNKKYTKQ